MPPAIHPLAKNAHCIFVKRMDPRVKPAGDGCAANSCVHHLLSPASASDARRRLASIAAARACTLLIQASAGARALGASSASSATAPARSPRAALASLRATTAAASLPGASSTRRRRTSFSAFSCSRPSTPSGGGATAACSAGASAENWRASVAAAGTPERANGSSAARSLGSAPSAFAAASSAAEASPRSTAALSAVAASASRTARSPRSAACSLRSTAATRLAKASTSLRSTTAGGFCASSASSAAPASARTRASRPTARASSLRRPRTPTASAIVFTSVASVATRAASAGSLAPTGGAAPPASSLATRPATSSSAFGSALGGGAREASSGSPNSRPARRASSALTPLSRLMNRLTSPSTPSTMPTPATATPSQVTADGSPRRGGLGGASGGGLPGTSGGSGLEGSSLEGVAGEASMRALLSPYRALRCFCDSRLIRRTNTQSRADARRCRSRFPAANLCAVWAMTGRQTRCTPLPLVGRGGGWGSCGSFAGGAVVISQHHPPPQPSPTRGEGAHRVWGGSRPRVRQRHHVEISRRPDEVDHGGLVRPQREADGGGAGGGERLRDLARETKVHQRERALEHAGARGAIEIGLRAAAGKMQDAVERTLRQRHRNVRRKALDLDRAISDRRQQWHAARGKIAGAVLAREIEERRGMLGEARAQQRGEIVRVAVGALDRAEARGARRLGGVAADREGGKRGELVPPGMSGDGARGVGARHHHRAQRLAREFDLDGVDAQQRRERDLVAARAQASGGALPVMLRPGHQQTHAVTRSLTRHCRA